MTRYRTARSTDRHRLPCKLGSALKAGAISVLRSPVQKWQLGKIPAA